MTTSRFSSVTLTITALWIPLIIPSLGQELASKFSQDLLPKLLSGSSISTEEPPRWSTFNDPDSAIVVNINSEADVGLTVAFCNELGVPFLAQNGGNGWATTLDLNHKGIVINLAKLNQVSVSSDKQQVTGSRRRGSNSSDGELQLRGRSRAILGGGYGNLMGNYGFGVDNVLSMRVITAEGKLISVTPVSNPDYFWAMRGAGPNFGIVTSAILKAYPPSTEEQMAWTGALIFTPDKLEQVIQALQNLDLQPDMNFFLYFTSSGSPLNEPVLLITPFLYKGNTTTGSAAFASLYAIGPVQDTTAVLPYKEWNTASNNFCARGAHKPSFGAGMQTLIPDIWRKAWNHYVDFQKRPGAENSVIILEAYSLQKGRSILASSAAFAHRNINFNAVAIGWYSDPSLDAAAVKFGSAARDLWRSVDGLGHNSTYINFANGDEDLSIVYGDNLSQLQTLKNHLGSYNRFNQWFNPGKN